MKLQKEDSFSLIITGALHRQVLSLALCFRVHFCCCCYSTYSPEHEWSKSFLIFFVFQLARLYLKKTPVKMYCKLLSNIFMVIFSIWKGCSVWSRILANILLCGSVFTSVMSCSKVNKNIDTITTYLQMQSSFLFHFRFLIHIYLCFSSKQRQGVTLPERCKEQNCKHTTYKFFWV